MMKIVDVDEDEEEDRGDRAYRKLFEWGLLREEEAPLPFIRTTPCGNEIFDMLEVGWGLLLGMGSKEGRSG
jgi:hypothetical protein